ncbi:MAG: hypothetical protein WC420_00840 [Candidatus Paceibacterota bacterium]
MATDFIPSRVDNVISKGKILRPLPLAGYGSLIAKFPAKDNRLKDENIY